MLSLALTLLLSLSPFAESVHGEFIDLKVSMGEEGHAFLKLDVDGKEYKALLDTAASHTVVDGEIAPLLGLDRHLLLRSRGVLLPPAWRAL